MTLYQTHFKNKTLKNTPAVVFKNKVLDFYKYICYNVLVNFYRRKEPNLENAKTETERKFLIKYPKLDELSKKDGCRVFELEQTYLLCDNGSLRVRKSVHCSKTQYIRNIKRRISDMSHYEDEKCVSEETYNELLLCTDTDRRTIKKTRYAIPYGKHIMEIDIYPFWQDRAILEVELQAENEQFEIPPYVRIIKEVTFDKRYSNKALAKEIITEEI